MMVRLVVFDLDGVLVDIDSSWREVHRAFGVDNEENLRIYLQGQMDYEEFMRSDISLWRSPRIDQVKEVLDRAPLMEGARETLVVLKRMGYKTAIISSGISLLAERVKETLGIDYSFANRLLVDDEGRLQGEGEEVVRLGSKRDVLRRLAEEEAVSLGQCAVVGDSRFDVPMFRDAGLSIAFNAKDRKVREAADIVVDCKDLRKILPWLTSEKGLSKAKISFDCKGAKEALSIVGAVSPDNATAPKGLRVKTVREGETVFIKVLCVRGVGTLLVTLDDLLSCVQVAENVVKVIGETLEGAKTFGVVP